MRKVLSCSLLLCSILFSCRTAESQPSSADATDQQRLDPYWYQGTAELNRYKLQQYRYGSIHEGDAVLIFVTEDFRSDTQVKYEGGNRDHVVPILKLNFVRKFLTGIYPYSMMTSVFTPLTDDNRTLKVSTSVQEWCGHVFEQLNLDGDQYKGQLLSYFQKEGDERYRLEAVYLEDELWTRLRIDPNILPKGNIEIIPATQYQRLNHTQRRVHTAHASVKSYQDEHLSKHALKKYLLEYRSMNRALEIVYEDIFPYKIVAWSEKTRLSDGTYFNETEARLTHSIREPYWRMNKVGDRSKRSLLGLD